jgi:hypothetical protein
MASTGALRTVTVEDQRSYIKTETLRGKNHTEIHSALSEVCGEQTVDRSTVCGEQTVDRSTVCGEQTVDRNTVCGEQTVDRSTVCGRQTVDRSTVSRCATRFREGPVAINDDPRPGRSKTSKDEWNVKLVADFLTQDCRATCEEISQATGISTASVFRILAKDWQKKKLCPMGPSLLDCCTENPGNCNITETKI